MLVERQPNPARLYFEHLKEGETFWYEGQLFMKMRVPSGYTYGVNLRTGFAVNFPLRTDVERDSSCKVV
jgi:hypothetical protein